MTLENDFNTLITEMEDNLQAMGVLDAEFDSSTGLRGLSARILDIEPSVSGLNLETSLTAQSEAEIEVGESVVISSKLNVFYDDETLVNVDLSGVLTGATVSIKEGNNIVGTGITNTNGIADINVSNLSLGTHNLKAVFTGTENFQECESNTISINVTLKPTNIDINVTKNILSYTDTDSTNITVTLLNENNIPVSGKTVTMGVYMKNSDNLVETLGVVDENDGTYTSTYNSQGVGDVYIKAECGLITETTNIEDCYINSLTDFHFTGASSDTRKYTHPFPNFTFPNTSWEMTAEMKCVHNGEGFGVSNLDNTKQVWCLKQGNNYYLSGLEGTDPSLWEKSDILMDTSTYYPIKIRKEGDVLKWYFNDVLMKTMSSTDFASVSTVSVSGMSYYSASNWNVRNIKVKPLELINTNVDNPILSYAHSTQENPQVATLTATINPIVNGKTVQIFKDDVLVTTETTDSQGQVSYEYTSQGSGDIKFKFKYGSIIETIDIEDCKKVFKLDGTDNYRTFRGSSKSFSNGVMTAKSCVAYGFTNESSFKLEFEWSGGYAIIMPSNETNIDRNWIQIQGSSGYLYIGGTRSGLSFTGTFPTTSDGWYKVVLEKENGVYSFKNGETVICSFTNVPSASEWAVGIDHYSTTNQRIRNIKVKPL